MPKRFLKLAFANILLAIGGVLTWTFVVARAGPPPGTEGLAPLPEGAIPPDGILALTFFAIGTTTFFGFLMIGSSPGSGWEPGSGGMRLAIAATMVLTYLFCVATSVYLLPTGEINDMTKSFIQSFSQITGVTVAFYFGASAAHQIFKDKNAAPEKERAATAEKEERQGDT